MKLWHLIPPFLITLGIGGFDYYVRGLSEIYSSLNRALSAPEMFMLHVFQFIHPVAGNFVGLAILFAVTLALTAFMNDAFDSPKSPERPQ